MGQEQSSQRVRVFKILLSSLLLLSALAASSRSSAKDEYIIKIEKLPPQTEPEEIKIEIIESSALREKAVVLALVLLDRGIKTVGAFDLETFVKETRAIRWAYLKGGFVAGSGEDRLSAVYLVEEKMVLVNELLVELSSLEAFPLILTHEALGVLGYDDENYIKTIALRRTLARKPVPPEILKAEFSDITRREKNQTYLAQGGVTSIGGGGDVSALEVKMKCIDRADDLSQDLQRALWYGKFKPDHRVEVTDFVVRWDEANKKLHVKIPSVQWLLFGKFGIEKQQNTMLTRLMTKIQEVLPPETGDEK